MYKNENLHSSSITLTSIGIHLKHWASMVTGNIVMQGLTIDNELNP